MVTEKAAVRVDPIALENIESWTGVLRRNRSATTREMERSSKEGDILCLGSCDLISPRFSFANRRRGRGDFHVLRPTSAMHGRFLQYLMLTREFIAIVDGSTYGAKMPRASWNVMGQMELPTPPLREQHATRRLPRPRDR